jgi:hypothetical protein
LLHMGVGPGYLAACPQCCIKKTAIRFAIFVGAEFTSLRSHSTLPSQ